MNLLSTTKQIELSYRISHALTRNDTLEQRPGALSQFLSSNLLLATALASEHSTGFKRPFALYQIQALRAEPGEFLDRIVVPSSYSPRQRRRLSASLEEALFACGAKLASQAEPTSHEDTEESASR